MSDDWTRKRRKEKFDKRREKRQKYLDGKSESDGQQNRERERHKPRKKNWSVDEFLDEQYD